MVPLAGRRLAADLVTDDLELPAGTDVTAAIWLTHTDPTLYPEPFAFRPERFLEAAPETYAWIPFGGGVRRCLGAAFAEFEMRIVLREILLRCELRKVDPRPERTGRRNITFSPRAGTPVVVDSRSPAGEFALSPHSGTKCELILSRRELAPGSRKGRGRLGHGPGRLWPWPRRPGVRERVTGTGGLRREGARGPSRRCEIRDEVPWNVTVRPVFFGRRDRPFVACTSIGVQATNAPSRPPAIAPGHTRRTCDVPRGTVTNRADP